MVPPHASSVSKRALGAAALVMCCVGYGDAWKAEASETGYRSPSRDGSGEMAALTQRPPAAKVRPAAAKPRKTGGAMAQIPVKLGYYVGQQGTCENPLFMIKLEPDGYWELSERRADSFRMEFGKVTRSREGGRTSYFIEFGGKDAEICEEDEPCISGAELVPLGGNRIAFGVQDTATLSYCAPERVPRNFRR